MTTPPAWHQLTYDQRLMVRWIAWEGLTNEQIGTRLGTHRERVKNRMVAVYRVAGVRRRHRMQRIDLVRWAWRQPIWQSDDDLSDMNDTALIGANNEHDVA